jgi:hypothetical protein
MGSISILTPQVDLVGEGGIKIAMQKKTGDNGKK